MAAIGAWSVGDVGIERMRFWKLDCLATIEVRGVSVFGVICMGKCSTKDQTSDLCSS